MNAIANITINRPRYSLNRKTGNRILRDVLFTGQVFEMHTNVHMVDTFDMILTGPRGGAKLVTVWKDGRFHWASESELRTGKGERGNVNSKYFEIVSVEML